MNDDANLCPAKATFTERGEALPRAPMPERHAVGASTRSRASDFRDLLDVATC
jgi:hypothetical protein